MFVSSNSKIKNAVLSSSIGQYWMHFCGVMLVILCFEYVIEEKIIEK